ncbi:hypothetical protein MKX01_021727, partial [Papaver californicum]
VGSGVNEDVNIGVVGGGVNAHENIDASEVHDNVNAGEVSEVNENINVDGVNIAGS